MSSDVWPPPVTVEAVWGLGTGVELADAAVEMERIWSLVVPILSASK